MHQRVTAAERLISRIKNNPIIALLVLVGTIVVGLATFTDAVKNISSLFSRQSPEAARLELGRLSLDYTTTDFLASAKKGDAYAIRLFLTIGMDPNTKDDEGNTPLMYAASGGHQQVVRMLLDRKANVNERDNHGETALSWAAVQKPDLTKLLVDGGADLEARNQAFAEAARHANPQVFPVLIKARISNAAKSSALVEAAGTEVTVDEDKLADTVRALLRLGASVNARNDEGRTPLLLAANRGHVPVARVLVNGGADIDAGCDCPTSEERGWTPLMAAIATRQTEVVDLLLARNANVNQKSGTGETALIIAADRADAAMARKLLERGADVHTADSNGRTVLMASTNNSGKTVDLMKILVEKGVNVNAQDRDGWTAVMWATVNLEPKGVEYLIEQGADVNARTTRGETALMIAAEKGFVFTVRYLLEHGARINDKDSKGKTALQHAREEKGGWRDETIQLLRKAGA